MLHLMHIEYHPTDVVHTIHGLRAVARWLDTRIREDATLEPAERADPMTVNLLARLIADDQPPTTVEAGAVRKFGDIVERATEGEVHETAQAAKEIALGMLTLAGQHDPVHMTLV